MSRTKLVLLNTSILTCYGTFSYTRLLLDEARSLVCEFQQAGKTIESAIGHESTADLLTMLLEFPVEVNRMEFKQTSDDVGLVFKLRERPPAGRILSREELASIGYEFGLLARIA